MQHKKLSKCEKIFHNKIGGAIKYKKVFLVFEKSLGGINGQYIIFRK